MTTGRYTLTIPLLTYQEAREIVDEAFGSMYWNTTLGGIKQAWPYNDENPVEIKPEITVSTGRAPEEGK